MKKLLAVFLILIISVSFCSCNNSGKKQAANAKNKTATTVKTSEKSKTVSANYNLYKNLYDKNGNPTTFPLIAEIPAKNIKLYAHTGGHQSDGAVLFVGNNSFGYNWHMNFQQLPKLGISDYDGDGREELAVSILNDKSDISFLEELHIIEINSDKYINVTDGGALRKEINPDYFGDRVLKTDDVKDQIQKNIDCSYKAKDDGSTDVKIKMNSQIYTVTLHAPKKGAKCDGVWYGSYINYIIENKNIVINVPIGASYGMDNSSKSFGSIRADCIYKDGKITLKNLNLVQ